MKIRPEQMAAFEQSAIRNFEQRMMSHLQEAFPKHCQILGKERLKEMIGYGWERAKSHGLIGENSIILFTDLMFLLGRGFDTDPQLPWAAEILSKKEIPEDEGTRTQTLYDKAIDYLNRVSGEKNEHIDAAQARLSNEKPEDFADSAASTLPEQLLLRLNKVFPQKYEYVGEACLRKMIAQGVTEAGKYGISDRRGIAVYIGLMYMLGAGFDTNPQFSWAAEILNNRELAEPDAKVEHLYAAAMDYLSLWCAS
jgi:hypothetical protein